MVFRVTGGGVNAAMYDSYRLSQEIVARGLDNIDSAVVAYEKDMLSNSRHRLKDVLADMKYMFSPDAPASFMDWVATRQ